MRLVRALNLPESPMKQLFRPGPQLGQLLSERDQRGFAEALLNPRDASDRLKRAAREYLEQTL